MHGVAGDNRLTAAELCSLMGLRRYQGRLKLAVAPSVRGAGGYCEWVLTLVAGVLHRQARAAEAMIDRCQNFELTKRERTSITWLSVLSRKIASSTPQKDVFFIWVSRLFASRRRCTDRHANAAINVRRQLILTNEKYRHLISPLLI